MTNIREKTAWSLVAALGLLIAASLAGVVRGGPLDPATGPESTPNGIDGREVISSLPFIIDQSGSYVVTRNLLHVDGAGIMVNVNDVTIDLNGFTLDGAFIGASGVEAPGRSNLSVVNGVIRGWDTGIYNPDISGTDSGGLFQRLRLIENKIGVQTARGARFDGNVVQSHTDYGVFVGAPGITITNSTFLDNATAIAGASQALIESNHIEIPAGGTGVVADDFTTIRRNYLGNNSLTGYVTIALGAANYVVAIENRMTADLTTGGTGTGIFIPYGQALALTNVSP